MQVDKKENLIKVGLKKMSQKQKIKKWTLCLTL